MGPSEMHAGVVPPKEERSRSARPDRQYLHPKTQHGFGSGSRKLRKKQQLIWSCDRSVLLFGNFVSS